MINTHWSQKKDYDIWHWKFSFGLGQAHTNMTGLNQLLWSKPSPLDNWIFNSNTYITNDNQIKQLRISSTVHHWISTMLIITFLFILFSNIPMMQYLFLIISLILEEIAKVNLILDTLSICTKTPQLKHVIMSCSMIQQAMYTTL